MTCLLYLQTHTDFYKSNVNGIQLQGVWLQDLSAFQSCDLNSCSYTYIEIYEN